MRNLRLSFMIAAVAAFTATAQRTVTTLNDGWQFSKGTAAEAKSWQNVRVPHDWAIYGPFDINNDLQEIAIEQNLETEKSLKAGRTGGLPFIADAHFRRVGS